MVVRNGFEPETRTNQMSACIGCIFSLAGLFAFTLKAAAQQEKTEHTTDAEETAGNILRDAEKEISRSLPISPYKSETAEAFKDGALTEKAAVEIAKYRLQHTKKPIKVDVHSTPEFIEMSEGKYVIHFGKGVDAETVLIDRKTLKTKLVGEDLASLYGEELASQLRGVNTEAQQSHLISGERALEIAKGQIKEELQRNPRERTRIELKDSMYYVTFGESFGYPVTDGGDLIQVRIDAESGKVIRTLELVP